MAPLVPALTSAAIRARRGPKIAVDAWRPVGAFVEPEYSAAGCIEDVATVLLANRECPFTCVFCDLWKHTLDETTPPGAIPAQMDEALSTLPSAPHIKLYNSGNFFDPQAIPVADWPAIADRLQSFRTVIVENHPRLVDNRVLPFRDLLTGQLEVALGLETVHPEILPRLNKHMTVADFVRAVQWLREHHCAVRAFVMLRLPGMTEDEGRHWAMRTIETAFAAGAQCVSVIPARAGNGAMDDWLRDGLFAPPQLESLHAVQEHGLGLAAGRVFVDLWDAKRCAECVTCAESQIAALRAMNLTQRPVPWPRCNCRSGIPAIRPGVSDTAPSQHATS